jgi:hypothetical protein
MAAVAVGITVAVSSCKKEEVKPVTTTSVAQQDPVDWVTKSGDWVKVKEGINIDGVICDKYQNKVTGQEVLVENYRLKATPGVKCNHKAYVDQFGMIDCRNNGDVCANLNVGGTSGIFFCKPVVIR